MQAGGFLGLGIEENREKLLKGSGVLLGGVGNGWELDRWIEVVVAQHCECTKCH